MRRSCSLLILAFPAASVACDPGPAREAVDGTASRTQVDSVVSRDEALQRFRAGLPRQDSLERAERSREILVQHFMRALARADTATLTRLAVTRSEFAYLYYEWSPQSLPPYDLSPELMWFTVERKSVQDLETALNELGGRPIGYVDHTCGEPRTEGPNRVYGFCSVRYLEGSDTVSARLFGLILERNGRFKFLSYGNKL